MQFQKHSKAKHSLINSTDAVLNTAFRHSTALLHAQNYIAGLILRFRQGPYVWPLRLRQQVVLPGEKSVTFNAYINNVQNLTSTPDIHLTAVVCIHAQSCQFQYINEFAEQTDSIKHLRPSSPNCSSSASQEITRTLRKPNVHYRVKNSQLFVLILS